MARNYETASIELENTRQELAAIETMTDEKACYIYNVDSKSEIVKIISEEKLNISPQRFTNTITNT